MTLVRSTPSLLLVAGLALTAAAAVWWGLTFWPVWAYDYLSAWQAGRCLIAETTLCRLAASLCTGQHRALVTLYSPVTLWIGVPLIVVGASLRRITIAGGGR